MLELTFKNIAKTYGAKEVLKNISLDVHQGEKIGLVGPNGCGKTTLLRIASGHETYQGGQLFLRKGLRVGFLDQMPENRGMTVNEVLRLPFAGLMKMQREMRELETQMAHEEDLEGLMRRYTALQETFEREGGYAMDEKVGRVTSGLGFDEAFLHQEFERLSGGQKTLVEFARLLIDQPDLLLLDEPTNHLDFEAITWLESYLDQYAGAVVVVSHDRYFLDKVARRIVEIEDGLSHHYEGNYTAYVAEKQRRHEEQLKLYRNQQKKIQSMEQSIHRFREWGRVSDDARFFKKAQNMEKRIEKMDRVDRPRTNRRNLKLALKEGGRSGKEVLMLEGVGKSFDGRWIYRGLDLALHYQDAVALVGSNGCGKSSLLKAVIGLEETYRPDEGGLRLARNARIAYLEQEVNFADESLSVLESVTTLKSMTDSEARHLLARYLFVGDEVFKTLSMLSGGERSRLRLCHLLLEDVNFMVLDEPTNHLDIPSREMLEEALIAFSGTVLFVSHDRYFINRIAQEVHEMRPDGLKRYIGNYDDYLEKRDPGIPPVGPPEPAKEPKQRPPMERQRHPFTRNRLEEEIEQLETRIGEIEAEIEAHATDHARLTELLGEQERLTGEWEEKWSRLLQLTEEEAYNGRDEA